MKNSKGIIIPVTALIVIGIVMVYSSTALMSMGKYGNGFHFIWRHLFIIVIGFLTMFFLARVNYQKLMVFVIPLLVLSLALLILVFVPGIGVSAGGARRWIKLWPSTFQPSELAKITMVLFLADYMSRNASRMKSLRYGIIIPISVLIIFQGIILLQPDFGAAASLGILTITLLFIGGVRWNYIAGLALLSLPVIYKLVWSVSYRKDRILSFLDPWEDPLGKGFQLVQSFIAFGRGGLTGVGIGASKQKLFYLPELHTDFIFSLIGEETGIIGAAVVLCLFIWFFIKGIKIAQQTEDQFGYYLAIGLTMMIVNQALINFAVAVGAMPTKGLPLPFISYGGSAALINMAAVGILISILKSHGLQIANYNSWVRR
ncbi:MAG: putative lipid II flippase FtsW [Nitrospirae bacterium]|nr:putative lipid II flippase FtsW [Nitrospirota bacterium]